MVKKLIFASEEGKFTRPKAHAPMVKKLILAVKEGEFPVVGYFAGLPFLLSPMVKKLISLPRKGSLPDRSLMPLPAHGISADHLVVPCNAQFRYPRSPYGQETHLGCQAIRRD
jgi:hypothetical protein